MLFIKIYFFGGSMHIAMQKSNTDFLEQKYV